MGKVVAIPLYICKRWWVHLAIVGVTVFLVMLVHRKIYEHFSTDSRYSIDLNTFKIANHPDWLIDEQLIASVDDSLDCTIKASIFDEAFIQKLRAHYESSPWVKKVELIERRLPNDLKVKLELRRPYVAVLKNNRGADSYYLVDKNSVRLPGEYQRLPATPYTVPIITGVRNTPPVAGEEWQDKGLTAALDVVANLEENKLIEPLQTKYVDVTNLDGRLNIRESEIVILTKDKIRIEWGRSPDTDKFGELAVADKIKNIKLLLEVCPELKGIKYAKIQFDQPYIALENR